MSPIQIGLKEDHFLKKIFDGKQHLSSTENSNTIGTIFFYKHTSLSHLNEACLIKELLKTFKFFKVLKQTELF
jgi:hypothetical protein